MTGRNNLTHPDDPSVPSSLVRERGPKVHERVMKLVTDMKTAMQKKQPINLSNPPHREITEALHGMVYAKKDELIEPGNIHELAITYNDVNYDPTRKKFPVYYLYLPKVWPKWENEEIIHKTLNIGTLSFRHVSYDDYVDYYLIRDRETRALNSYEIQDLAYDRMTQVLRDPALNKEVYISLYQTGLEPLVVGAYLAITENLYFRKEHKLPCLFVKPVFFADPKKGEDLGARKFWGFES